MAKQPQNDYDTLLEQQIKVLELNKDLKYHSTANKLYLEIDTPNYTGVLVRTDRLRDLLFHMVSFNLDFHYHNLQKGKILELYEDENAKVPKQLKESLSELLLYSNEIFSYAYLYFPKITIVKKWKKLHEPEEKVKTIVKD